MLVLSPDEPLSHVHFDVSILQRCRERFAAAQENLPKLQAAQGGSEPATPLRGSRLQNGTRKRVGSDERWRAQESERVSSQTMAIIRRCDEGAIVPNRGNREESSCEAQRDAVLRKPRLIDLKGE
jgi:hypothetical protein